ncbi:helix-turn-helix domain-containing protein [Phascolarctobacterium sp.]|uniref:helix-turn-helix domain-containing protein n=1 Tax=Phascolarctobacterium sp. TaxID=2049039 RepID=UPI00386C0277
METEKSVGTILREARLAKGLSLAEVEKGTSIRSKYLEAVENDAYEITPGEVFVKGMIRNYGNYLGLDGPALVDLYKASAAGKSAEDVRSAGIREVEKVRLNIQLKDPRDIGSGTGRFEMPELPMKQIAMGAVAVIVLAAGYFGIPKAIDYFSSLPKNETKAEQQVEVPKAPVILDKVQVEMEAADQCWLEVTADGKEIFAGMLQAKDKKVYEAKDKLIIKYGNIGVMKITVNGEPVNLQGEHGVAVKTYTRLKQE